MSILKDCGEIRTCDLKQIKEDHFDLIVKKIDTDNNIHKRVFIGKTILGKDTTIYTSVFSSIDVNINDTIEKVKGELVYKIKSKNVLEERIYFVDDYGECGIKNVTLPR